MKKVLLTSCFVALAAMAGAKTIYVSPSGSASADGSSWATAVNSLPAALSLSAAGDEIWMAAGTYTVTQTINVLPGVDIYGGFAGTESSIDERVRPDAENAPWQFANETILTGSSENGRLLDHEDKTSYWEDGVIVDGVVVDNYDSKTNDKVFYLRTSCTVRNCWFRNIRQGGKIVYFEINGLVEDCMFENNSASDSFNGNMSNLYCIQMREDDHNAVASDKPGNTARRCVFQNNQSQGISVYNTTDNANPVLESESLVEYCTFRNNHALCLNVNSQWPAYMSDYGVEARRVTIQHNLFEGNSGEGLGTGSTVTASGTGYIDFAYNIIRNNSNTTPNDDTADSWRSSVIYCNNNVWITNCLIVNNTSNGLLIYLNNACNLYNTTVANNVGTVYMTTNSSGFGNSIILNNTPTNNDQEIVLGSNTSLVMNCATTSELTGDAVIDGCITADPAATFKAPTSFVGADAAQAEAIAAANYSLADGSNCIGAGEADYANMFFMSQSWIDRFMALDLAGNARLTDGAVNIGAYEGDAINGIAGSNVAAADLATVYVDGNVLTVVSEDAASVEVYSLNGALVAQDVVNGAANIALPQAGLYIVKVVAGGDAQSFKVLARN